MWQDCFVISFSCKLNRSDEREPPIWGLPLLLFVSI